MPVNFRERGGVWVVGQGLLMAVAVVAPVWFSEGSSLALDHHLKILGLGLIGVGGVFAGRAVIQLRGTLTPFPAPMLDTWLIEEGAFAWVRHPIYAGLIFAATGWALIWLSFAGLLAAAMLGLLLDRKAAYEESLLEPRFPEYLAYRKRVKKLIPWFY